MSERPHMVFGSRRKDDQQTAARDFVAAGSSPFDRDKKSREAVQHLVKTMQSSGKEDYRALQKAYLESQGIETAEGSPAHSFLHRFTPETLQLALQDPQQRRAFFEELVRIQAVTPLDDVETERQVNTYLHVFESAQVQARGCTMKSAATLVVVGTISVASVLFSDVGFILEGILGHPIAEQLLVGAIFTLVAFSIVVGILNWLRRKLSSVTGVISLIITLVVLGLVIMLFMQAGMYQMLLENIPDLDRLSGGFR